MDKNWLIRTKSNHILGPISKEKVLELYQNGSIKSDDEVCTGNGYWFFIREDDLVERFLIGQEVQSFNPISEAKDILTNAQEHNVPPKVKSDITMVGNLNVSMLNPQASSVPNIPPVPDLPSVSATLEEQQQPEIKKKNNPASKVKPSIIRKPLKKQSYLKYAGILGFIVLILLIYYRKVIIRYVFEGEITASSISFVSIAHAQEVLPEKKKSFLESFVSLDKVVFIPSIGLNGFVVKSAFDIELLTCQNLNNEIYQLGIILYPPEVINEKFMIKLRDCVLKMNENHPVKKWMKWIAEAKPINPKELTKRDFVAEIINSQFNLITDLKLRNEIIKVLPEIPENTIPERLLRSFLYLMIGNITRSDNIMREIINSPPRVNWEKSGLRASLYHKLAIDQASQILSKLSKHPADRRSYQLLSLYFQSYYNDDNLLKLVVDVDTNDVENKLGLKYVESLAPSFVHFLKLENMSENRRIKTLRNTTKYTLDEQSYWFWLFMNIDPLISDALNPELIRLEKEDQMWFVYLLENEKLADSFSSKNGKSFLPGRRPFLKQSLEDHHTFMMALYKLIELGDIDQTLVNKTTEHLIHD